MFATAKKLIGRGISAAKNLINNGVEFVKENGKKALAAVGLGFLTSNAMATGNGDYTPVGGVTVDPTTIYSALTTPFNSALTWVIGAIGVLVVIGWILKAVRRK